MADDTQQQQADLQRKSEANQLAYKLYTGSRSGQNPYISQQSPLVQRYFGLYERSEQDAIAKEIQQQQQNLSAEKMMTTRQGAVPVSSVSQKPTLTQFMQPPQNLITQSLQQGPATTRNISPIQQNIIQGPNQAVSTQKGIGTGFNFGNVVPSASQKPSFLEFIKPPQNILTSAFTTGYTTSVIPFDSNQQPLRLSFGEALGSVGRNLLNTQVIGQAQEPITGVENYFKQALFDPFKNVFGTYASNKNMITNDRETLKLAKEAGYQIKEPPKYYYARTGKFNAMEIVGSPTNQQIFETGKKKLFEGIGINYSNQLLGSFPSQYGEKIVSEKTLQYQTKLNEQELGLQNFYQGEINTGKLNYNIASDLFKKQSDILQRQTERELNLDITTTYSEGLSNIGLFTDLSKFESKIYTPKSEALFNIALPVARLTTQIGLLSTGTSEATFAAAAINQAFTYKDYASYSKNFNQYTTSEKIIGGLGIAAEQVGTLVGYKAAVNQFNVEDLNLRIESLALSKGQFEPAYLIKGVKQNEYLLSGDIYRETSSGFSTSRIGSKLTFYEVRPEQYGLDIFSVQATKGQVYNPATYSYQPFNLQSTGTANIPYLFSGKELTSVGSYPAISNEIVDLGIGKGTYLSKGLSDIRGYNFYAITQPREGFTDILAGTGKGTTLKLYFNEPKFSVSDYNVFGSIKNIEPFNIEPVSTDKIFSFGKFSTAGGTNTIPTYDILTPTETKVYNAITKSVTEQSARQSSQIFQSLNIPQSSANIFGGQVTSKQLTLGYAGGVEVGTATSGFDILSQTKLIPQGLGLTLPTQNILDIRPRSNLGQQGFLSVPKGLGLTQQSLQLTEFKKSVIIGGQGTGVLTRTQSGFGGGLDLGTGTSTETKQKLNTGLDIGQQLKQKLDTGFGKLVQTGTGLGGSFAGFSGGLGGFPIGLALPKSLGGLGGFGFSNKGFGFRNVKPSFTAVTLGLKGKLPKSQSLGGMNIGILPSDLRLIPSNLFGSGRKRKKSGSKKKRK